MTEKNAQNTIRLDKYLASLGAASRRGIAVFLKKKRVTINGQRVLEPGIRLDLAKDRVSINGQEVKQPKYVYIMLNKPKGVISTASDEYGRENVTQMVEVKERVFPVGRLDKDTTGLILLTNDGEIANKITHPRYHMPKTYQLLIAGSVAKEKIRILREGVDLEDGKTAPAKVSVVKELDGKTVLRMVLYEGRKRQIRRMCEALHIPLLELKRISIGPVLLKNLKVGKWRYLSEKETADLKKSL